MPEGGARTTNRDDHATIQLGAWYADPGNTVIVECGTFYENLMLIGESITLMGETGDPGCVSIETALPKQHAEHVTHPARTCRFATLADDAGPG